MNNSSVIVNELRNSSYTNADVLRFHLNDNLMLLNPKETFLRFNLTVGTKSTQDTSATGEAAVLSLNRLEKSVTRVPGSSRRHSSLPVLASKHSPIIIEPISVSLEMGSWLVTKIRPFDTIGVP